MPDNDIYHLWLIVEAEKLRNEKKFREALNKYDESLSIKSTAWGWYSKGITLYRMERYLEAIEAFERSLAIEPRDTVTWEWKQDALKKLRLA
jgi:tetratricopeptide (TPR) repeat protein